MFASEAYAQTTVPAADAPTADTAIKEPSPFGSILPLLLIFVVFYFLLIRPQQKKLREHQSMIKALRRGDKVVTGGGIMGSIVKVDADGVLHVEIAPDVKVKVLPDTIASVVSKPADAEEAAKGEKSEKKSANDN